MKKRENEWLVAASGSMEWQGGGFYYARRNAEGVMTYDKVPYYIM